MPPASDFLGFLFIHMSIFSFWFNLDKFYTRSRWSRKLSDWRLCETKNLNVYLTAFRELSSLLGPFPILGKFAWPSSHLNFHTTAVFLCNKINSTSVLIGSQLLFTRELNQMMMISRTNHNSLIFKATNARASLVFEIDLSCLFK